MLVEKLNVETIVHVNGSKWGGDTPDTIDTLMDVLKDNTIEEKFFECFYSEGMDGMHKWFQQSPIDVSMDKSRTIFCGNFEEVSHLFRISTDDKEVIEKLSKAIMANKGWELYREKNLIENK